MLSIDNAGRPVKYWLAVDEAGFHALSRMRSMRRNGSAAPHSNWSPMVNARLHMQTLSVTGWTNFWLARETEVALVENLPNVEKSYMAGALYRVRLDQT